MQAVAQTRTGAVSLYGSARRLSRRPSDDAYPDERLDGAAFVHSGVRVGDAVEVGLVVENASRIDAALEDVAEQLGQVGTGRRGAALYADVAEEHALDRQLDAMGHADVADRRSGSGDAEGRRHRLARADAFERSVDADAAGHL